MTEPTLTALMVFLISSMSFGIGFWVATLLFKEDKKALSDACDEAIEKLEKIVEETPK